MSTHWKQQFRRCVFSKVVGCSEENIRQQMDCQETIEYETNEQSTRYLNWNMQIQI